MKDKRRVELGGRRRLKVQVAATHEYICCMYTCANKILHMKNGGYVVQWERTEDSQQGTWGWRTRAMFSQIYDTELYDSHEILNFTKPKEPRTLHVVCLCMTSNLNPTRSCPTSIYICTYVTTTHRSLSSQFHSKQINKQLKSFLLQKAHHQISRLSNLLPEIHS